MADSLAKSLFPTLYNKLEKNRQNARSKPLTIAAINTLLSMQFNNKPLFPSIEDFYSEPYQKALEDGLPPAELEKIERFRKPTEKEFNLLHCDIHARDEMMQYSASNQTGD
jgi:hypothetical protein